MSRQFAGFVARRYRWFLAGASLALLVITCESSRFLSLLTTPSARSMESVFTRIHVGMDRGEAVRVLDSYGGAIDSATASGSLKDGRPFDQIGWDNLPEAEELAHCTLSLMDEYGEGVEVVVGVEGKVIAKRYTSDSILDEWRVAIRSHLRGK